MDLLLELIFELVMESSIEIAQDKKEIPNEYLPNGFDATENNAYRIKMLKD